MIHNLKLLMRAGKNIIKIFAAEQHEVASLLNHLNMISPKVQHLNEAIKSQRIAIEHLDEAIKSQCMTIEQLSEAIESQCKTIEQLSENARQQHNRIVFSDEHTHLVTMKNGLKIFIPQVNYDLGIPLINDGLWEPWIVTLYRNLLSEQCVALNIGASLGMHLIEMARLCGSDGVVWGVEPNPLAHSLLKKSLSFNGFHARVRLLEKHADKESNNAKTFLFTPQFLGGGGFDPNPKARATGFKLKPEALESFFEEFHPTKTLYNKPPPFQREFTHEHTWSVRQNVLYESISIRLDDHFESFERLDLILIDVEGFEGSALQGCMQLIEKHLPSIISEFSSNERIKNSKSNLKVNEYRKVQADEMYSVIQNLVNLGYEIRKIVQNSQSNKPYSACLTINELKQLGHEDLLFVSPRHQHMDYFKT